MAAFAQPTHPASANDAPSSSRQQHRSSSIAGRQLPNGPCNWRDLNQGRDGFQCGCRQFWLNDVPLPYTPQGQDGGLAGLSGAVWCFCGHHACFHASPSSPPRIQSTGRNADRLEGNWNFEEDVFGLFTADAGHPEQQGFPPVTSPWPLAVPTMPQKSPKPNTAGLGLSVAGNSPGPQHTDPAKLPRFSFSKLIADDIPSTQSSARVGSEDASGPRDGARRSPNRAFLEHVTNMRQAPRIDVRDLPRPNPQDDAAQSATEIATPSNAGTPALRETDDAFQAVRTTLDAFNRHQVAEHGQQMEPAGDVEVGDADVTDNRQTANAASSLGNIDRLLMQISNLKAILSTTPNLRTSLASLNHRLDALETASFSHVSADDLQDRLENFDGRLLDVEGRVEELEKQHNVTDVTGRALKREHESQSNVSFLSTTSSFAGRAAGNPADGAYHNVNPSAAALQLASLEQRLVELESNAMPTFTKPWEVEVVLLPWGGQLKGLWLSEAEASQASGLATQDSNLISALKAAAAFKPQRPIPLDDPEWTLDAQHLLSARACGPTQGMGGRIFERLKSRGFVRNVVLKGNSAKHVGETITSAFNDILSKLHGEGQPDRLRSLGLQRLIGLQAPFVPLRKVHRSSRLQFLTHAELTTPSVWTAEFLNSSVFMKAPTAGQRKLFITHSAAYIQSPQAAGWTWQKIRELPRVGPPGASSGAGDANFVPEADAKEPCWEWDSRLDPPLSVHSSFTSGLSYHGSFDSEPLSPQQTAQAASPKPTSDNAESDGEEDDADDDLLEDASRAHSPITPVSELPPSRHSQRRPLSAPPVEAEPALPKRQIASFEQASPARGVPKRRRISRSPDDVELMAMWNLTPRRSREPPSPMRLEYMQQQLGRRATTSQQRQAYAYATPYSGEAVMSDGDSSNDRRATGSSGFNGEARHDDDEEVNDEDAASSQGADDGDAWEGVDEDEHDEDADEADDDDDDEDELVL